MDEQAQKQLASQALGVNVAPRDIGWAIAQMRLGERVTRQGWNGKGQFLELQVPDTHSKMTLPYVFITTVQGQRVPWLCSQTDLLACDWQEAPPAT